MNQQFSSRYLGTCGAVIAVALAAACGGRAVESGEAGGGTSSISQGGASGRVGSGGSMARGGSSSAGGSSRGGASSVGGGFATGGYSNVAGTTGFAGAGGVIGVAGVSGCGNEGCPAIACGPGFYSAVIPPACCPTCVPNTTNGECLKGQQTYFAGIRNDAVAKFQTLQCHVDSDCTIVAAVNQCESGCPNIPVLASESQSLLSVLNQAAMMDCSTCPPMGPIPCPFVPPATCQMGHCAASLLIE